MKSVEIEVKTRPVMTKNELSRFRNEGNIPAILYGRHIKENIQISFGVKSFAKLLSKAGTSSILIFKSDDAKLNGTSAMIKDVQRDPVSDVFLNVDLLEIRKDEKITIKVPIEFVGVAAGTKQEGVVDIQRRELQIQCLPTDIPEKITVDITNLELNQVIHVSDVKISDKVKILDDASFSVVSCRVVKEVKVEETAVAAEGAEGAVAAEGAAPAAAGAAAAPGAAPGAAPAAGKAAPAADAKAAAAPKAEGKDKK